MACGCIEPGDYCGRPDHQPPPGCIADHRRDAPPRVRTLAAESGIDTTRCEICGGPLDAEHPWRRGMDGAAAHEACLYEL